MALEAFTKNPIVLPAILALAGLATAMGPEFGLNPLDFNNPIKTGAEMTLFALPLYAIMQLISGGGKKAAH